MRNKSLNYHLIIKQKDNILIGSLQMLAQNYKTLLQNTPTKQNLIFGVEFKNPTNTVILYKQHMYSLFLLLYYHGEPQHKAIIFDKLKQLKDNKIRNNQLLSTDASDGDPRKKLHLNEIEMIEFVEQQLRKQEEVRNDFHSLAQRQYIRYTFKQIFEMDEALTLKSEMNIADFAKLAAALIKVVVNIKDYFDFQLIQFLEDEFLYKKVDVFIQISKQKQTYRYIKQKTNPKLLNQHQEYYQKSLMFRSIVIEKVQSVVDQSDIHQNEFSDQVSEQFEESLIASPPQSPLKYHQSNSLHEKNQQKIKQLKKVQGNIKMIDDTLKSESPLRKSNIKNGGQAEDLEQNEVAFAQQNKNESFQKSESELQQTKDQISKLRETSLLHFLGQMNTDCLKQMPEIFFQQVNKVMQKKVSVHQLNQAMKELAASSKGHIEIQEHKEGKKRNNQVIKIICEMSKRSLNSEIDDDQKKGDIMKSCLKSTSHCQKNEQLHDEKSGNQINNPKGIQLLRFQKKSVKINDGQGLKQKHEQNKQKEDQSSKQTSRQNMNNVLSAQKGLSNRTPISSKGEENRSSLLQSRPYSSVSYSRPSSPNYHENFSKMISRISQRKQRRLSNTSQVDYKRDYGRYTSPLKSNGNLHQNNGEIVGGITSQIYERIKLMNPLAKETLLYQHADYLSLSKIGSRHKYHYPL